MNGDSINDGELSGEAYQTDASGSFTGNNLGGSSQFAIISTGPASGLFRKLSTGTSIKSAISTGSSPASTFFDVMYGGIVFLDSEQFLAGEDSYNGSTGYLGLSFNIGGNTHYGWLEVYLSRNFGQPETLNVLSAAYSSAARAYIPAGVIPEPSVYGFILGFCGFVVVIAKRQRRS